MAALNERRMSSSVAVMGVWEAMTAIRCQKQASNLQRIAAYMKKSLDMSEDVVEEQLILMVIDSLLNKTAKPRTAKSPSQETFQLPSREFVKGTHDWYCFECHISGKVLSCATCHRVYHPSCVQGRSVKETEFVCPACKMLQGSTKQKISAKDLTTVLSFVFRKLKDESPKHLFKIEKNLDEAWQLAYMLYDCMDLVTVEAKINGGRYRLLQEFHIDILLIVHNFIIIYGGESEKGKEAKQLLSRFNTEMEDIRNCPNCYRLSNEKATKMWFCVPCDPPHELVYAKQTGWPYWPAKVISKTDSEYDIRFFGAAHLRYSADFYLPDRISQKEVHFRRNFIHLNRAIVPKSQIKPITTEMSALGTKKTAAWKKACDELNQHQKLLGQSPVEVGSVEEEPDVKEEPQSPLTKKRKASQNDSEEDDASALSGSHVDDDAKDVALGDSHNVVSSTQDNIVEGFVTSGTQTFKTTASDVEASDKMTKIQMFAEIKIAKEKAVRANTIKLEKKHHEEKERAVAAVQKELTKCQEEHQRELEKCLEDYQRELKGFQATFQKQLAEAKKKQWCYNCEREAVYHCCWNTSYCSVECQQVHWQKDHKRNCRRKRNITQHNQTN